MKLRVEADGETLELQLQKQGNSSDYTYALEGRENGSESASVIGISPGVFSVLLGARSFTVYLSKDGEGVKALIGNTRLRIAVSDARDRRMGARTNAASGPMEIRSQMPGKIIKVLVTPGSAVTAGQGLLVVEAMKMQNEMKSPKDGIVTKIQAEEGATVGAGEPLIVIE